jgi:glucose/arabinose dehydrogenase
MRRSVLVTALVVSMAAGKAGATTLPAGFTETLVANGITAPTAMEIAPDGRIFVLEQPGRARIIKNGALLTAPFLTVTVNASLERGLLGIAFDPAFATNHFVYVYYTATSPAIHNRVSRFTANGDVAVAGSELVLLDLPDLSSAENHNGGAVHFGPDGKLYIGVGENANPSAAPLLTTPMGKILRLNADGTIPTDNPFYTQTTGINRAIWAKGLRNPFTFAFQPGTGRLFIDDVGNVTWEEIDEGVAGKDYGWGPAMVDGDGTEIYKHGNGQVVIPGTPAACAIIGGTFYNPATANFPSTHVGRYFFTDYCGNWIRTIDPVSHAVVNFATDLGTFGAVTDMKVAADGTLYYLARGDNSVFSIRYTTTATPTATGATPTATARPTATSTATRARVTATATRTATPTSRPTSATPTPTTGGVCTGIPAFQTCTAYPTGAKVVFNNSLYHSIAPISASRDCPPLPYNPGNDNWWTNDGACS